MQPTITAELTFAQEPLYPLFYMRGDRLDSHYYLMDAHPNDKKSKAQKGKSKGMWIGLVESMWIGVSPVIVLPTKQIITEIPFHYLELIRTGVLKKGEIHLLQIEPLIIHVPKPTYTREEVRQIAALAWATASIYGEEADGKEFESWFNTHVK